MRVRVQVGCAVMRCHCRLNARNYGAESLPQAGLVGRGSGAVHQKGDGQDRNRRPPPMPKDSRWQPGSLETLSMVLAVFILAIMERT
jgi:hypothetical protein